MLTWAHEETVLTTATDEQVWGVWSTPNDWHQWDNGLEWARLDGPFVTGSRGRLKPVGGPEVTFVLLNVLSKRRFTNRSFLPLTHLDFIHSYTPGTSPEQGGQITVRIEMHGWLTPLFRRIIGRDIQKTLPETLRRFARQAEKDE